METTLHSKQQKITYLASAVEYGFLAILLGLIIDTVTGLLIALSCAAMHLVLTKQARLAQKWFNYFAWHLGSAFVDFVLITIGLLIHFELLGGRVFGNVDGVLGIVWFSIFVAAGVAGVRVSTTIAIKLLGFAQKNKS
jgi:hypothetical protein